MGNYEELLRQYYARFFPYREFHKWLSYGDNTDGVWTQHTPQYKGQYYKRAKEWPAFLSRCVRSALNDLFDKRRQHKINGVTKESGNGQ